MAKDEVPRVPTAEDMKAIRAVKDEDLSWVPPPPTTDNRYLRKMKENPFVPIGMYSLLHFILCSNQPDLQVGLALAAVI